MARDDERGYGNGGGTFSGPGIQLAAQNQAAHAAQAGAVVNELRGQEEFISELFSLMGQLEERLQTVLIPRQPDTPGTSAPPGPPLLVSQRLGMANQRLHDLGKWMNETLARIDL